MRPEALGLHSEEWYQARTSRLSKLPPLHVINESPEEVEWRKRVQDEGGAFLTYLEWQLYLTPTFRSERTSTFAQAAVERLVNKLGPRAFAFTVVERGSAGHRLHPHALIGGLDSSTVDAVLRHPTAWWRHGALEADRYDPTRGACWYLAKSFDSGQFIGRPLRRTRRARGR